MNHTMTSDSAPHGAMNMPGPQAPERPAQASAVHYEGSEEPRVSAVTVVCVFAALLAAGFFLFK